MSVSTIRLLLSPRDAAAALGISERKLWYLTHGDKKRNRPKELPCVRVGRAVRYDVRDLEAWIDRLKAGQSSASEV